MINEQATATLSILNAAPTTLLDADKMDHDFDFFKIKIHFPNGKYGYNNVNRLCLSAADHILSMAINPDMPIQHYAMANKDSLTAEELKRLMVQQMGNRKIELKVQKFSYKEFTQSASDQVILARLLLNSLPKRVRNAFGYHSSCTNEELWTIPPANTKNVVNMFVIRFEKQSEFTERPILRLSFTEYTKVDPTDSRECADFTLYHFENDEFVPVYDKKGLSSKDRVFIHRARSWNAKPYTMKNWPYLSQGPKSSKILSSRDTMYHQTMDLLNEAYSDYLLTDQQFTFARQKVINLPAIHEKRNTKKEDKGPFIRKRLAKQWSEIEPALWPHKIQLYAGNEAYIAPAQKTAEYLELLNPLDVSISVIDRIDELDFSQPIIQIVQKAPDTISIKSDQTDDYLALGSEKVVHISIGELSAMLDSKSEAENMINYTRSVMNDLFISWCMEKQVIPFAKGFLPNSLDNIWIVKEAYVPSPNEEDDKKKRKVRVLIIFKIVKEQSALRYKSFTKVYPKNNGGDPFFGEMDQINFNDPDLPILNKVLQQYMLFTNDKKSYLQESYLCNPEQGLEAVILNPGINILSNEEYYRYQEKVIRLTLTQAQLEAFADKFDIKPDQLIQRIQTQKKLWPNLQRGVWTYDAFQALFDGKEKLFKRNKQADRIFEEMFGQPFRLSQTQDCLSLIGGLRNLSYWSLTPLSIAYSVGSNDAGNNGFGDRQRLAKGTRVRVVKSYTDNQISTDFIDNYSNVLKSQLNALLRYNFAGATSAPLLMMDHYAKQQAWRARKLRLTY